MSKRHMQLCRKDRFANYYVNIKTRTIFYEHRKLNNFFFSLTTRNKDFTCIVPICLRRWGQIFWMYLCNMYISWKL